MCVSPWRPRSRISDFLNSSRMEIPVFTPMLWVERGAISVQSTSLHTRCRQALMSTGEIIYKHDWTTRPCMTHISRIFFLKVVTMSGVLLIWNGLSTNQQTTPSYKIMIHMIFKGWWGLVAIIPLFSPPSAFWVVCIFSELKVFILNRFGIVLLELLSGRKPLLKNESISGNKTGGTPFISLADWVNI